MGVILYPFFGGFRVFYIFLYVFVALDIEFVDFDLNYRTKCTFGLFYFQVSSMQKSEVDLHNYTRDRQHNIMREVL
jgi:hypothetical protein